MRKIKYINLSIVDKKTTGERFPKIFAVLEDPSYGEVSFQTLNAMNLKKAVNGDISPEDRYVENKPDNDKNVIYHIWNIDQQEKDYYKGEK